MLNDLTALPSPTDSTSVSIVEARFLSSIENPINDIEHAMALLKIKELKQFKLSCLDAIRNGKDAILFNQLVLVSQFALHFQHFFHLEKLVLSLNQQWLSYRIK